MDDVCIDSNFSRRAQMAFNDLNDGTDWTWKGLARAFSRRYELDDLMEFMESLDSEIEGKK